MWVWSDYEWKPSSEIMIPIASGLLKTLNGIFTTTRIYQGKPIWADLHLQRLTDSSQALEMNSNVDYRQLAEAIQEWPGRNQIDEGALRVYLWSAGNIPHVLVTGEPMIFNQDLTWKLGQADTPRFSKDVTVVHKTLNRLALEREYQKGLQKGNDEVVFVNEFEELTETSRGNLFWYSNGTVCSPALECGLLAGIGRHQLISICRQLGYPLEMKRYQISDLKAAEAVIVVNSLRGIIPVKGYEKVNYHYQSSWISDIKTAWQELLSAAI